MSVKVVHNERGLDLKRAMLLEAVLKAEGIDARIVNYGVRPSGNPARDRRLMARNYWVVS